MTLQGILIGLAILGAIVIVILLLSYLFLSAIDALNDHNPPPKL